MGVSVSERPLHASAGHLRGTGTPSLSFGGPILVLGELRDSTTFAVAVEGWPAQRVGLLPESLENYSPQGRSGWNSRHDSAGGGGGVLG